MVSEELIKELQIILKEDYKKEVSFDDATSIANDLVAYFSLLGEINSR